MASALDALPSIKDNASACMALKCTESELFELKKTVKFEMAQEVYNGQALLKVTKLKEFDPDRKHRDDVRRRVAQSDPVAREPFQGSRWPAADRIAYQEGSLVKVMDWIIRTHSFSYKHAEEKKAGKRLMRSGDRSTAEPEEKSPAPKKTRDNEALQNVTNERMSTAHVRSLRDFYFRLGTIESRYLVSIERFVAFLGFLSTAEDTYNEGNEGNEGNEDLSEAYSDSYTACRQ
ncbi:uncharacterized protein MYCFIDRAFT_75477 [Pseudocercospora fijiensis CIRAD86]|uniref:Uncharacterized protein n=1 Tax=Pseudocercospora fijiensis (strain CIRAD86) TaxID=383855 RepID=N1Q641_PSEFD|nr:uncharacterized protein MYCFIDRAFT_75477 [Pseudocercospora fijiensis CIRAD86]EME87629.1 hypothetical protein MYCFIDRAFT_75477 [Pseudocercospora fijiensis CIRAD86]